MDEQIFEWMEDGEHPAGLISCYQVWTQGITEAGWCNLTIIDPGPLDETVRKAKWALGYNIQQKRFRRDRDLVIAMEHDPGLITGLQWLIDHHGLLDKAKGVGEIKKTEMEARAEQLGVRI